MYLSAGRSRSIVGWTRSGRVPRVPGQRGSTLRDDPNEICGWVAHAALQSDWALSNNYGGMIRSSLSSW